MKDLPKPLTTMLINLDGMVNLNSASNYNKNTRRVIKSIDRIERQVLADHSDLTFKYLSNELSCIEIGFVDHGPNGTKELQETEIKLPK